MAIPLAVQHIPSAMTASEVLCTAVLQGTCASCAVRVEVGRLVSALQ